MAILDSTYPNRIKHIRTVLDITQVEFAESAGLYQYIISEIESGKRAAMDDKNAYKLKNAIEAFEKEIDRCEKSNKQRIENNVKQLVAKATKS